MLMLLTVKIRSCLLRAVIFCWWSLDKDWVINQKRFMTGSAEFFDAETKFNYDLDEDVHWPAV